MYDGRRNQDGGKLLAARVSFEEPVIAPRVTRKEGTEMEVLRGSGAAQPRRRAPAGAFLVMAACLALVAGMAMSPTCALAVESTAGLVAWGANSTGELGNGTTENASRPVAGSGLVGVR